MIRLQFDFVNPWKHDVEIDYNRHWVDINRRLFGNRNFMFEIFRGAPYSIFKIDIDLAWRGSDHAGPGFEIEIYGYTIHCEFYDSRHWDWDRGAWEDYDDDQD